ncbi:MAG: hypothetical protein U0992_18420 [Planctomycetaceae bacterium]
MSRDDVSPTVLFVDDEQETLTALADQVRSAGANRCEVISPEDLDDDALRSTDLVVVDFTLDAWIDRIETDVPYLMPINGIALSAVLREQCHRLDSAPPTGFALITGKPDAVSSAPGELRPHVIARLSNLEWFFEKQGELELNVQQIIELARAIQGLPAELSQQLGTLETLLALLGVQTDVLKDRYADAVERCRPPLHHLSQQSGGLILLRWLLHRILPHTCFLIDTSTLAARLRVTPRSLHGELDRASPLLDALSAYKYTGPLANFDGPRWWRSGVEQWLWEITEGQSANADAIYNALFRVGAVGIQSLNVVRPVVTLDKDLRPEQDLSARDDVVALHLDDWPSYAEPAYMRRALLKENSHLKIYEVR